MNAEIGLREADASHPDAIILDLRMPLVDGLGFLRRLREHEGHRAHAGRHRHRRLFPGRQVSVRAARARRRAEVQAAVAGGSRRPRPQPPQGDPLIESGSRFLSACRRQPVDATPVWFMRQAGRYMGEYRALRERYSLLDLCRTPDLATEVTLQPIRRIEVDAAILFSDLLLPLEPMGIRFDFIKGEGPAIENPMRRQAISTALRRFEPREALAHVLEAIRQIKRELAGRVPLIGFAGAPFTLASYAIEGGHSTNFAQTKALMYGAPAAWHRLCDSARRDRGRLPRRADRGGRRRRAGVRLVGRRAERRATTASSSCPTRAGSSNALRAVPRADDPFRRRHRRDSRRAARGGRRRHRRRLADSARRGLGRASAATAPSRATSIPRCCWRRSIAILAATDDVLARAGGRPGQSSIWGTGSCP